MLIFSQFYCCQYVLTFMIQQEKKSQEVVVKKPFMEVFVTEMAKFFSSLTDFCVDQIGRYVLPVQNGQIQDMKNNKISKNVKVNDKRLRQNDKAQSLPSFVELSISQSSDIEPIQPKKKVRPRIKPQFASHKPKAPTSSYLLFLHEKKAQISSKFNLTSISQIAKIASEQWKKIAQPQKQRFNKQSEIYKIRYHEAMKRYKQQFSQEIKQEKRKKQIYYKQNWQINKEKKKKEQIRQEKKRLLKAMGRQKKEASSEQLNSSASYKQHPLSSQKQSKTWLKQDDILQTSRNMDILQDDLLII